MKSEDDSQPLISDMEKGRSDGPKQRVGQCDGAKIRR